MSLSPAKKVAASLAITFGLVGLSGCERAADVASRNISQAADNFEINRRIVFFNGITDNYLLSVEGKCSIEPDSAGKKLDVTCKDGPNDYKKHFLGLSDNVSYFVQQLDGANVSEYHTRIIFRPQTIVPDFDVKGDVKELLTPRP